MLGTIPALQSCRLCGTLALACEAASSASPFSSMFFRKARRPPDPFDSMEQIRGGVRADDAKTRGFALQSLLTLTERDPTTHAEALAIYRDALARLEDPWTAVNALLGLSALVGADHRRETWIALLDDRHPPELVAMVIWSVTDPTLVGRLLEILARRTDSMVRRATIRVIGKLGHPSARIVLEAQLAVPELLDEAILALADLGDPASIPALTPYLDDASELSERDERGAVLSVADIAHSAIRGLQMRSLS